MHPDGTLERDQNPTLSPGRVTVIVRQEVKPAPTQPEDWVQYRQRIRAGREASGYPRDLGSTGVRYWFD